MFSRRRFSATRILLLALALFIFVSLLWGGVGSFLRRSADIAAIPLAGRFANAPAGGDREELARKDARIRELEDENAALRRTVAVSGSIGYTRIFARILWSDPDPARNAVRILLPSGSSIAEGDTVVAPGDVLVGKVTRVYARSADVTLVNDPEFSVSVRFGEQVGAARGDGGNGVSIQFVSSNVPLPENGAAVSTAGLGEGIPGGLLVGWLVRDDSSPGDPFAKLSALSAVDLSKLHAVEVLMISGKNK